MNRILKKTFYYITKDGKKLTKYGLFRQKQSCLNFIAKLQTEDKLSKYELVETSKWLRLTKK